MGLLCQINQVSAEARETQARYGTISDAARRLTRKNAAMVRTIKIHSSKTSAREAGPNRQAKNSQDQTELTRAIAR